MKTFLVGGAVRDQLLNFPYTDKDWVVVGSTPQEMATLGYLPVGQDFPVFLHPQTKEEYALARTERKTAPGYKGFSFHTSKTVTLEEDLQRRDLTINAMAQDDNGQIIDPYGGQYDIDNKYLRHVSTAFSEDPVRILRVARFAARYHHLGFRVATETMNLMKEMVAQGETQHLVAERIWQECHGAFNEKNPEQFLCVLRDCHASKDIFPNITDAEINRSIRILTQVSQVINKQQTLPEIPSALAYFAALCQPLSLESTQLLSKALHAPNEFTVIASMMTQHYNMCTSDKHWTTQSLANLFKLSDAPRKKERFTILLTLCLIIHRAETESLQRSEGTQEAAKEAAIKDAQKDIQKDIQEDIRKRLLCALDHYMEIDPQALIKQGYEKAALGEAINQQRLTNLSEWLKQQEP